MDDVITSIVAPHHRKAGRAHVHVVSEPAAVRVDVVALGEDAVAGRGVVFVDDLRDLVKPVHSSPIKDRVLSTN